MQLDRGASGLGCGDQCREVHVGGDVGLARLIQRVKPEMMRAVGAQGPVQVERVRQAVANAGRDPKAFQIIANAAKSDDIEPLADAGVTFNSKTCGSEPTKTRTGGTSSGAVGRSSPDSSVNGMV